MNMNRKTFLRGLGLSALGAVAGPAIAGESTTSFSVLPPFRPDDPESFWGSVRALYPLEEDPLYLNTGGLGPTSQPVLDTVAATMRRLQEHSETGHDLFDPARETLARFLGASPDEICFTRNATEANSIIAAGLSLRAGDEVIFDSHAHPGGSFPWLNQAKQRGIVIRLFEPDPRSSETNLSRIHDLISPRTKVIQVSHITCTTGVVLPVKEIAALSRERGIWSHFDGAQAVGMIPVNLNALGCDSYAVSGHKWLGGPHETGVLYLRRSQLEAVAPTGIGAYSGELSQLPGELTYRAAASRHEYGTRNAAAIVGLAEAVRLQEAIGRDRISAHGGELATRLIDAFQGIAGIETLTPLDRELRGSMIAIRHPRANAAKLFGYLLKEHRLRCRPVTEQGLEAVRISLHVFNSSADCARIITGVRQASQTL
jgi:selenocysteine lyase/cysteine desulfurase